MVVLEPSPQSGASTLRILSLTFSRPWFKLCFKCGALSSWAPTDNLALACADFTTPREEVEIAGWTSLPDVYAFRYQDIAGW